jgi:hypothetical protein
MRGYLCAFVTLFLSLSLASLWGQGAPSSSTASPPDPSAPLSLQPLATWTALDEIWTQLESEGQSSSSASQALKQALSDARSQLTTLSGQLDGSRTQVLALSSSLAQADQSLASSVVSLKAAQAQARRRSLEAGLWRAGTLAAALGLAGALLDPMPLRGAGIGAGIGGALGGGWMLAERLKL